MILCVIDTMLDSNDIEMSKADTDPAVMDFYFVEETTK